MATFLGLPGATRRSKKALSTGLYRRATTAPMNKAVRTLALPPPMKLLPRHCPDCRVKGARPTSAAICLRPRDPSSGDSAMSVPEITGPMLERFLLDVNRNCHGGIPAVAQIRFECSVDTDGGKPWARGTRKTCGS